LFYTFLDVQGGEEFMFKQEMHDKRPLDDIGDIHLFYAFTTFYNATNQGQNIFILDTD